MYKLNVTPRGFSYARSDRGITQTVAGRPWLLLMQMEADDAWGAPEKHNGALAFDRNFQLDGGSPRERVGFDSIINALPVDFYRTAAGLSEVTFLARLDAEDWRIQILQRVGHALPRVVAEATGTGAGEVALDVPFGPMRETRLHAVITYRGTLQSDLLAFATPKPDDMAPIGLSITTYNKPQFLLPNLEILRASLAAKAGLVEMLVVNNGAAIEGMPDGIEVLTPGNIGGTGGFLTAHAHFRDRGFRHFIIMDDDIVIPPDLLDRFFALSCLVKGRHVGSMAELLNVPERIVKEQGADLPWIHTFGLNLHNAGINIQARGRNAVFAFQDCDFSGWWALMVDLTGPRPSFPPFYFIKRDDITFGFESRQGGVPTAVFPNLLVAHSEEGATSYYYYDIRNDLVMRARNAGQLGISVRGIAEQLVTLFLTYRLDLQRMFNKALADFLDGPAPLAAQPVAEKLKEVRALAAAPVPLPEAAPRLISDQKVPVWRMLAAWVRPSAWRRPDPVPVVEPGHRACVTELGAYIAALPHSETGVRCDRSLASVWAFLRGGLLVLRLSLTRGRVVARYQQERG